MGSPDQPETPNTPVRRPHCRPDPRPPDISVTWTTRIGGSYRHRPTRVEERHDMAVNGDATPVMDRQASQTPTDQAETPTAAQTATAPAATTKSRKRAAAGSSPARRASRPGLAGPYGASFTGEGARGLTFERRWTTPGRPSLRRDHLGVPDRRHRQRVRQERLRAEGRRGPRLLVASSPPTSSSASTSAATSAPRSARPASASSSTGSSTRSPAGRRRSTTSPRTTTCARSRPS